ncbi:hypothetical protein CBL_02434 [Carabus blaptoides fortunei]
MLKSIPGPLHMADCALLKGRSGMGWAVPNGTAPGCMGVEYINVIHPSRIDSQQTAGPALISPDEMCKHSPLDTRLSSAPPDCGLAHLTPDCSTVEHWTQQILSFFFGKTKSKIGLSAGRKNCRCKQGAEHKDNAKLVCSLEKPCASKETAALYGTSL